MTAKNETAASNAIEIFCSYSHVDEVLRKELYNHMSTLKRNRVISGWHDREITPGDEWAREIDKHLKTAQIILLLVSSDFLASDYCYGVEVGLALKRHDAREARVIPIILRPCDWTDSPFARLQGLPRDAKAITSWGDRDEAFRDVAIGIKRAAQELKGSRDPDPDVVGPMTGPSAMLSTLPARSPNSAQGEAASSRSLPKSMPVNNGPGAANRYDRLTVERRKPQDGREFAERDYDRIFYSSALRRLGGVTQVVAAHEGHVFHNRLTHSLQVSQLARRLAQKFLRDTPVRAREVGGIDADVAEAAGLAHDLGHPPFGHIAEEVLRECVEHVGNLDAFEGNAQSFRIVTKLALSSPQAAGLNLTRATLNALLKYPWTRQSDGYKKKRYGLYQSEQDAFDFARQLQPVGDERKSAEAEIMDWADDVTYAVHDVEDFYRARLIPLDRLASLDDNSERQRFFDGMYLRPDLKKQMGDESRSEMEELFLKVIRPFPISEPYTGTRDQRSNLRYFSSVLIGQFLNAIELQRPSNGNQPFVKISRNQRLQVRMLKGLTWFYVIYNPALATQQYGQRKIIRELFDIFRNAATSSKDEERNIIPFAFRDAVRDAASDNSRVRLVADLIAGMTEQGLVKLHKRLTGVDMGSVLDHVQGY